MLVLCFVLCVFPLIEKRTGPIEARKNKQLVSLFFQCHELGALPKENERPGKETTFPQRRRQALLSFLFQRGFAPRFAVRKKDINHCARRRRRSLSLFSLPRARLRFLLCLAALARPTKENYFAAAGVRGKRHKVETRRGTFILLMLCSSF